MTPNRQPISTTLLIALGVGALCEHSLIGREWWTMNPAAYIGELLGGALGAGALAYFPILVVQRLLVRVSERRNQQWPKRIVPAIVVVALLGVFAYDTAKLYLPYFGGTRTTAIREMTDVCSESTKNSLPSATDQQRRAYCTCMSNTVIDKSTPLEFRNLTEPSNVERFQNAVAGYAKECGNVAAAAQ